MYFAEIRGFSYSILSLAENETMNSQIAKSHYHGRHFKVRSNTKRSLCNSGNIAVTGKRSFSTHYASVNFSCAQPPPPGNCGAFDRLVSTGGGPLTNFACPSGRALANPGGTPEKSVDVILKTLNTFFFLKGMPS